MLRQFATSPAAHTPSAEVRSAGSVTMPLSVVMPAPSARPVFGVMPTPTTTASAGTVSPDFVTTPVTDVSPSMRSTPSPNRNSTP